MVGRDVLLRVEKPDHKPGEPLLAGRGRRRRATTAACPPCATSRFDVRAGEIVGIAGVDANGQSELIEAIMGLRKPDDGTVHRRRPRRHPRSARATRSPPASATSPRTATGAASCSSSTWPRTSALRAYRDPTFSHAAGSRRARWSARARGLLQGVRRPRRRRRDARRLALGRQPAEGRDRPRAQRRPAGDHRRPAHARAGRRRDRVRAPAAGRGARRGPRRAARLARARGDPLVERSCAGDLRGRDRGRAAARVLRGGLRRGHDRRRGEPGAVAASEAKPRLDKTPEYAGRRTRRPTPPSRPGSRRTCAAAGSSRR